MQFVCPCCQVRTVTIATHAAIPSLVTIDRYFINEKLEDYNSECNLNETRNGYIDQSLVLENPYQDDIGAMISSNDYTGYCACGASFNISFPIMLTGIKIPVKANKQWLSEDIKDVLDIQDDTLIRFEQDFRSQHTGYHGASVPGCIHNYIFQRRINGTNEAEVKCSKCNDIKRM